ncbi:MAG: DUF2079 domain-containing protein [Ardenticatenaceae bacterium]
MRVVNRLYNRFLPPNERGAALALAVLMVGFFVLTCTLSLLRYQALRTADDLVIYSQVVWNTWHGRPFYNTMLQFSENYLGNHFTPILAFFVPIYALWTDPRVLLIAQVIASTLVAWPLYRLATEKLSSAWAGVLFVMALYLYPALIYQTVIDFHGIALGTPLVMLAFYALLTERNRWLFAILPWMFLIREDVVLVLIMMGVYAFVAQQRFKLGVMLMGLGSVGGLLVLKVLIPAFRSSTGAFFYNDYYGYLGDSFWEMVQIMVLEPPVVLKRIFDADKLKLVLQLLFPVAFMPLLSLTSFILGGSAIAYMLLVDLPFIQVYHLGAQYQALWIPFIFIGAVLGVQRVVERFGPRWGQQRVGLAASGLILVTSLIGNLLWGPFTDATFMEQFQPTAQSEAEWGLLAQIPPTANVIADSRFTAALSTRLGIYELGDLPDSHEPIEYLLSDDTPVGYPLHAPVLLQETEQEKWQVPRFEQIDRVGTVILRQRRGEVSATKLTEPLIFEQAIALRGASGLGEGLSATPGQPLEVALIWQAGSSELPRLKFFAHLVENRSGAIYRWGGSDKEIYDGLFTTDKWQAGAIAGNIFSIDIPSWMPPGQYELQVGLYTVEGMTRLSLPDGSTSFTIASVDMAPPLAEADKDKIDVPNKTNDSIAQGLKLRGYAPLPEQATVGQLLDVVLFWRATEPMSNLYEVRFELLAEEQTIPPLNWTQPLVQARFPNTIWEPETVVADWHQLALPNDIPPGAYQLFVTVVGPEEKVKEPRALGTINVAESD